MFARKPRGFESLVVVAPSLTPSLQKELTGRFSLEDGFSNSCLEENAYQYFSYLIFKMQIMDL